MQKSSAFITNSNDSKLIKIKTIKKMTTKLGARTFNHKMYIHDTFNPLGM